MATQDISAGMPAANSALYGAARPVTFARRMEALLPYLLLAPAALFLAVFFALPMVQALLLAIQKPDDTFTLDYVQRMVSDVNFTDALRNTLVIIALAVPLQFVLAIIMGLVIQARPRGASLFLYFWTIPLGVSDLAAGLVWLAIFSDRGFLNSVLQGLGLLQSPFAFLSFESPVTLVMAVVIAELWRATSIVMVIVVAGLQLIPPDYLEAAEVFGANRWQRVWHVMLPMIRPSLQVALILRTILAFQIFAVAIALAGRALPVLASEAYNRYGELNPNLAAAYAGLILLFSLFTTALYLRTVKVSEAEAGK
jgi:multiple sugar transport system permease protein